MAAALLCTECGGPSGKASEGEGSTAQALGVTSQCPAQTVEGIDVFDGQGVIDWSAVSDAGVVFAWIKATQGTYDTQATFRANWEQARAAGVVRGAYHFFDPREDGAAQAQRFVAAVGALEPGDLPAMLDVECPDGDPNCVLQGVSGQAPAADIGSRVQAFLQAVEAATGRPPVLYTFETYFASSGVGPAGLDAYPLFLAYPTTKSCIAVPAPWSAAAFWQYSWTGAVAGVKSLVDRDRFLGSRADLLAFAIPSYDGGVDASPPAAPVPMGGPPTTVTPPAQPGQSPIENASFGPSDGGAQLAPPEPRADAASEAPDGSEANAANAANAAMVRDGWGCHVAGAGAPKQAPGGAQGVGALVIGSLATAFGARRRRTREVAGNGHRVLAGPSNTPCRRPTSAKASRFRSTACLSPWWITNSLSPARGRPSHEHASRT